LAPPPVAEVATELGIPLHQTGDAGAPDSVAAIQSADAEVGVVCAFGQLIREPLLSDPPMLNIHPSLLPRWRGAAPIERAIMAGDETTGVCVMRLTAGLDSGPVALSESARIASTADYGELAAALADLGSSVIGRALDLHEAGELGYTEQDEAAATYANKIDASDRRVEIAGAADEEARRIRALTPHIGAYVELADGLRLGVRDPEPLVDGPPPGEFAADDAELVLGLGSGALRIGAAQPPGKRWIGAADYLRGYGVPEAARGAGPQP
jgi:methionyl-tRNA formyltransferase